MMMKGIVIKYDGKNGIIINEEKQQFWFFDTEDENIKEGDYVQFLPELYKTPYMQQLLARFVKLDKEKYISK